MIYRRFPELNLPRLYFVSFCTSVPNLTVYTLIYTSWMPSTRTEVVYEFNVGLQGRLRTAPPLTYNINFASHSVVILSTVRVATHCDQVSCRSIPRALSAFLILSTKNTLVTSVRMNNMT